MGICQVLHNTDSCIHPNLAHATCSLLQLQELVLKVQLPGCQSAGQLELDVDTDSISLTLPGRYHLAAKLPFPVKEDKGRASFDKARQQLDSGVNPRQLADVRMHHHIKDGTCTAILSLAGHGLAEKVWDAPAGAALTIHTLS